MEVIIHAHILYVGLQLVSGTAEIEGHVIASLREAIPTLEEIAWPIRIRNDGRIKQ